MAAKGMSDGDRIAAAYTLGKLARCGGAVHRLYDFIAWVRRSRWDVAEAQALYDEIVVRAGMADVETLIDLGVLAHRTGLEAPDLARCAAAAFLEDPPVKAWREFTREFAERDRTSGTAGPA